MIKSSDTDPNPVSQDCNNPSRTGKQFLRTMRWLGKNSVPCVSLAVTVWLGIVTLSFTAQTVAMHRQSLEETRKSRAVAIISIQVAIRSIYREQEKTLNVLDARNYPTNGRHYGEAERSQIRSYFTDPVFSEFITFTQFQNGALSDEWPRYKALIRGTLKEYQLLREEYTYFRRYELSGFAPEFADAFGKVLDEISAELHLNLDVLMADREKDIQAAKKDAKRLATVKPSQTADN